MSGWPLNSNKVEAVAVLVDMLFFYFVDGNRNLNEIRAKFMIKAEDSKTSLEFCSNFQVLDR